MSKLVYTSNYDGRDWETLCQPTVPIPNALELAFDESSSRYQVEPTFIGGYAKAQPWNDSESIEIKDGRVVRLHQLYSVSNSKGFTHLLKQNPELIQILIDAACHIRHCFGEECSNTARLIRDPGSVSKSTILILISTQLSSQQAYSALEQFDRLWWRSTAWRAKGLLEFDVELKSGV